MARYLFLDPRSRDFFVQWETVARDSVAAMRIEAGRNPHDRGLQDLVGELSTRSEEFATWWAAHNVKIHTTATKTLHHPIVGELELTGEALALPGDPGLIIITYTVEPEQHLRRRPSTSSPAGAPNQTTARPRRHRSRPTTPNSRADPRRSCLGHGVDLVACLGTG